MSAMSDLDLQLQEITSAMSEQPADLVGRTLRDAFAALDDLMVLANKPETKEQVRAERVMIGQLLNRCQLLASFCMVETPGKLRIIRNG